MLLSTSYFAMLNRIPNPLSICINAPSNYTGPQYKELAPNLDLFIAYKNFEIDANRFILEYKRLVLDLLDPQEVYKEIVKRGGPSATLLCYEKPNEFCHRHLVADWLNTELKLKLRIQELKFPEVEIQSPSLFRKV